MTFTKKYVKKEYPIKVSDTEIELCCFPSTSDKVFMPDGTTTLDDKFTGDVINEAGKLNPGANINGVHFDGTKDIYITVRCRF